LIDEAHRQAGSHPLRGALMATILATASNPGFAQQAAFQPPTATELSALRNRLERLYTCTHLAKKLSDTRGGHSADWGDPTVDLRYDPTTDHCYVEMVMVSPAGLWEGQTQPTLELLATTTVYTTLWNGQTQELLATTTISQNGRSFGTVFANDPKYKIRCQAQIMATATTPQKTTSPV
jgi:hypothetical protein